MRRDHGVESPVRWEFSARRAAGSPWQRRWRVVAIRPRTRTWASHSRPCANSSSTNGPRHRVPTSRSSGACAPGGKERRRPRIAGLGQRALEPGAPSGGTEPARAPIMRRRSNAARSMFSNESLVRSTGRKKEREIPVARSSAAQDQRLFTAGAEARFRAAARASPGAPTRRSRSAPRSP